MGNIVNNSIIDNNHFWNTETIHSSLIISEDIHSEFLRETLSDMGSQDFQWVKTGLEADVSGLNLGLTTY